MIAIILALAACSAPLGPAAGGVEDGADVATPGTPRLLTLILGQSNAVGQGDPSDLDTSLAAPFPDVTLTCHAATNPSQPFLNYAGPLAPRATFGAEISLGRALPDRDIAICAVGSTSLAVDWAGSLYTDCVSRFDAARVTAILWFQGERDARVAAHAMAYGDNLRTLVGRLRSDFPLARFFYYRLVAPEPYLADVQAGQDAVAVTEDVTMVRVDGLPMHDVHFTSAGYVQLGELFAEAIDSGRFKSQHSSELVFDQGNALAARLDLSNVIINDVASDRPSLFDSAAGQRSPYVLGHAIHGMSVTRDARAATHERNITTEVSP